MVRVETLDPGEEQIRLCWVQEIKTHCVKLLGFQGHRLQKWPRQIRGILQTKNLSKFDDSAVVETTACPWIIKEAGCSPESDLYFLLGF